jgi:hypothetical protein
VYEKWDDVTSGCVWIKFTGVDTDFGRVVECLISSSITMLVGVLSWGNSTWAGFQWVITSVRTGRTVVALTGLW